MIELLTLQEVADLFRVNRRTVATWAKTGRLATIRTPGGHPRFRKADVERLLEVTGVSQ